MSAPATDRLRSVVPIVLALIAWQALVLWLMGRTPFCTCGTIKLWHGVVNSPENSQQILDWYSFSHVLHGFAFYFLAWLIVRRAPLAWRLVLAVTAECSWEILENTDFIIDRYRAETISLNYYGDSILNSVFDTIAMVAGFVLAARLPVALVIALAVFIEAGLAFWIRDNLTLNIVMLLYPFDAIRQWQAGAPLH